MKKCPFCAEEIQDAASVCRYCQRDLATGSVGASPTVLVQPMPQWNKGVAAVLSLFIPGAGQIYKGQILNGLAWLFFVVIGYVMFIVPGVLLHIVCIFGAASGDPYRGQRSIGGQKQQPGAPRGAGGYLVCPHCGANTGPTDKTCTSCGRGLTGRALLASP